MDIGSVIWITGLSGAGKSTIGQLVYQKIRQMKVPVVFLDGDTLRELFGRDLGHTPEDRLVNAKRLSNLCRFLSEQGIHVVCATMSLFKACHEWNRKNLRSYYDILIDVPLEILKQRDARKIYSRAARGEIAGVAGVDLSYDLPDRPHLVIDNSAPADRFEAVAARILLSIPEFRKRTGDPRKHEDTDESRIGHQSQ